MKLYAIVILFACCLLAAQAAPEKKMAQKSRQADQDVKVGQAASSAGASTTAKDPSSGRLFLKKFLTFKNLFSSSNQPVIPIIITGAGTGTSTGTTSPTSPTVTVTSTGTIPSATGTITTSPTTPTSPTTTTARRTVIKGARYGSNDDEQELNHEQDQDQDQDQDQEQDQELAQPAQAYPAELMDEQALQAALAAGAQEYEVVTSGHDVQGTSGATGEGAKATQSNNHISLRRKGARRGQVISVRIPPRYRRYFKNGQKVMLNTGSRPASKRRVVRKRVPAKKINKNNNRRRNGNKKNRRNRNKNRRNRITAV
ncbi:ubiquitin carboxyl-terminal hydrolase 36 [Drosophila teissieri]|uniref:ubiquitin carboxyl-terminal hydrolase 36 n=1 Tax=Drosophila teissieri TaxID=7243 RepID=UPI001CBA47A8|nr:ubiquitin carboxyl-terminal hydrolase 36 [Drosophila teissieri]